MQTLANYDASTTTAADDANREQYMLEMLRDTGADGNKTRAILRGMGYDNFKEFMNGDGTWKDGYYNKFTGKLNVDTIKEKLRSQRQRNVETISNAKIFAGETKLDDGTELLDNLTDEEVSALFKNLDTQAIKDIASSSKDAEVKLAELRFELKKITMGDFASATEYLSVFSS